ncbi:hypothetical protein CKQ53_08450 [Lonsdalea britannica]|uniref:YagK/YfjJ C-terminal domain-containing protein n=1 Tax=Lonsdalea britannica TaxID=1082704 RepID=A0AAD0WMD0_9GAMM|nr:hypothetical protein CKQ53_08450 [Lonsdalea britannica]
MLTRAKKHSQSGKCHYHVYLLFNKDAYYYLRTIWKINLTYEQPAQL